MALDTHSNTHTAADLQIASGAKHVYADVHINARKGMHMGLLTNRVRRESKQTEEGGEISQLSDLETWLERRMNK